MEINNLLDKEHKVMITKILNTIWSRMMGPGKSLTELENIKKKIKNMWRGINS